MVVTYRSHRSSLKDSLLTKKVFNDFTSFLNYVLLDNKCCFPSLTLCKADVSFVFNSSYDDRCGWFNIYCVCIKNRAMGFCTFNDVEKGKDLQWILKN